MGGDDTPSVTSYPTSVLWQTHACTHAQSHEHIHTHHKHHKTIKKTLKIPQNVE